MAIQQGDVTEWQAGGRSGPALMDLVHRLYPICRSITGPGVRQTLDILGERIDLQRHEVPTGTRVFDWEIPREWRIHEAWVRRADGEPVVDFADHNLHLLNYSVPFRGRVSRDELGRHVHTLPDRPDWIPYRTSYYREEWGFCLRHRQWQALPDGDYDVLIDSALEPGALTLAECVIPGESDAEFLLSTHVCHPSMCNDNLSGIVVLSALCEWLASMPRRLTYRAVFAPGTIGSLSWLWLRQGQLDRIRGGLVLCGLGGPGPITYKRSRRESAFIDRLVERAVMLAEPAAEIRCFSPYGYDERQYCSPGFDLPVGRLSRTPHGEYPEYHTSADDLAFVDGTQLERSLALCRRVVEDIERGDRSWINLAPHGEPHFDRRGLAGVVNEAGSSDDARAAIRWVLNLSDGRHTLLDIAERSGFSLAALTEAADRLRDAGLLVPEERQAEASQRPLDDAGPG